MCPDDIISFPGFKIVPTWDGPSLGIGTAGRGLGMYLNFNYNFTNTELCARNIEQCLRFDAVHEFGHALGFLHEHMRDDADYCKFKPTSTEWEPTGDTLIGPYDLNSVMNYCNPNYDGPRAAVLSATDIEMVQKWYGKPTALAYVASTSTVLGVVNISSGEVQYPYIYSVADLPSDAERRIHKLVASPDGRYVYIAIKEVKGGEEVLRRIDVASQKIDQTLMVEEKILDLKISPDSKSIYVLHQRSSGLEGVRVLTADIKIIVADIPVPHGKLMARPRIDNDVIYAISAENLVSPQAINKISIENRRIVSTFEAGMSGNDGFSLDLTPNEKEIFVLTHVVAGDRTPRLARIDVNSTKFEIFKSFPENLVVSEIQAMDQWQVLYATNTKGMSPGIYKVDYQQATAFLEPNAVPFSFPYAFSSDGRSIFSMYYQNFRGQPIFSLVRFDRQVTDKFIDDDLGILALGFKPGILDRPIAFVNPGI